MQSRVRTARMWRTAVRALALAVAAWAAMLTVSVVSAPTADAAPAADVVVRDLTPPLVSIDPGGTVTFSNGIQDKTLQVGGGGLLPSLVTVVVHTDVTLTLPSGTHPLQPGQAVSERFGQSCLVGCAITYTYRATVPDTSIVGGLLGTVTGKALALLPQNQVVTYNGQQTTVTLGVPTPFLVNTLVPLPNLPSVNLPRLPAVTVPAPTRAPAPAPAPAQQTPAAAPQQQSAPAAQPADPGGTGYTYGTGAGAARLAPSGGAAAAFDPSRLAAAGSSSGTSSRTSGSGGVAGSYDGATAPVFGELAGLDRPAGGADGAVAVSPEAAGSTAPTTLSVPALLAVIALAGVSSALLRVQRARRAGR